MTKAGRSVPSSYSPDGRLLLSSGDDNIARLWSVETGEELSRFDTNSGFFKSVAISPDSRQALSKSGTEVILIDLESRTEIRRFGTSLDATNVSFSPDGKQALSGSGQRNVTIGLWDLATGEEIRRFAGHGRSIVTARFLPSGRRFVSSSSDNTLRLWDVETR